jgi:MFS transporter, ACDE family, multidrug resistance protein
VSRRPPLAFIFTVTLTGILTNTLITPALPDILDEFGVPSDRAGLLVAAGSVAGIFLAPVAGLLADRYGRRVVLTTCLVVFGLSGGLAALAPTFNLLLLARLVQGMGSSGLVNLAVVLIGDHWSGVERTRLVGRNSAVLTIGLAGLPLVSGATTEAFGWRVTFAIYTLALITAGVSWLVLDSWRPEQRQTLGEQVGEVRVLARQPVVLVTLVTGFLAFIIIFGLFLTVFPVDLAERFGLSAGSRGVVIALPAITSTLMAFNLGRIRGAVSSKMVLLIASAGFAVAYLTLGLAVTLVMVVPAVLVVGASEGLLVPTLQDLAMDASSDEHRGAIVAVWVSSARLGQTVGPILAGLAIAAWGTATTLAVGSSVAVLIFLLGLFGPLVDDRHRHHLDRAVEG